MTYDPRQGFTDRPETLEHIDRPTGSGIPFIDIVHWPFELVLQRIMTATTDTLTLSLVSRSGMVPLRITRLDTNRFTATHPSQGVMEIETDGDGQPVRLTAGNGAPPLRVTRGSAADIAALAAEFARRDAAGRSHGRPIIIKNSSIDSAYDYVYGFRTSLWVHSRSWNSVTHLCESRPPTTKYPSSSRLPE
jgi:hypothetical protein